MPEELDIPALDAEPRLRLLTDALRAGPGSAEWAAAVAEAQALGPTAGLDEFAVLVEARRRLADGRHYRSVRAGPGFGRRLMARVDADLAARPRSPLSASWLAYVGVGLVVASLGLVLALVVRSTSGEGTGRGELAHAAFSRTFAAANLTSPLPPQWNPIGPLGLDPAHGLAVIPGRRGGPPDAYAAGGIVTRRAAPAEEPVAVEATFHFGPHVGPGCVPQLFVADSADFNADRGVSPREVVWLVQDGQGQVALADNRVADPRLRVYPNTDVTVSLRVGPDGDAAVVCNGQVLWVGPSGLTAQPRYAGVRLLARPSDGRRDAVTVTGLSVKQR